MALPPPIKRKRLDDADLAKLAKAQARLKIVAPTNDDVVAKPTDEGRARAEAERLARAKADTAARDLRQQPGVAAPKEDKGQPAAPAAAGENNDDLTSLARLQAAQQAEREAQADELKASKASQLMEVKARNGLAGLGLSGASAAQVSDTTRKADRSNTLAMADLDRKYRQEGFDLIGDNASVLDLEDAYDLDFDGDGQVGGRKIGTDGVGDGDVENDIADAPKGADVQKQAVAKANEILGTEDYSWWDAEAQPGSAEEPYTYAGTKAGLEAFISESGPDALPLTKVTRSRGPGGGGDIIMWMDKFGNYYTIVADGGRPSRRENEVAERDA